MRAPCLVGEDRQRDTLCCRSARKEWSMLLSFRARQPSLTAREMGSSQHHLYSGGTVACFRGNQQGPASQVHFMTRRCPPSTRLSGEGGVRVFLVYHLAICCPGHCDAVCCPDSCLAHQGA